MNGIGGWFRQLGAKFSAGFRQFMAGRYGTDKLNTYILGAGVIVCLLTMFLPWAIVDLALSLLSYVLLFWALFRTFSRNTYKRYQENRKYLRFMEQLKDKEHRYFDCPRCHQSVRVPKGKGKIAITCPKCKEKFVKKT
jgi:hypothetical protein